jgi:hypothetical protein
VCAKCEWLVKRCQRLEANRAMPVGTVGEPLLARSAENARRQARRREGRGRVHRLEDVRVDLAGDSDKHHADVGQLLPRLEASAVIAPPLGHKLSRETDRKKRRGVGLEGCVYVGSSMSVSRWIA